MIYRQNCGVNKLFQITSIKRSHWVVMKKKKKKSNSFREFIGESTKCCLGLWDGNGCHQVWPNVDRGELTCERQFATSIPQINNMEGGVPKDRQLMRCTRGWPSGTENETKHNQSVTSLGRPAQSQPWVPPLRIPTSYVHERWSVSYATTIMNPKEEWQLIRSCSFQNIGWQFDAHHRKGERNQETMANIP